MNPAAFVMLGVIVFCVGLLVVTWCIDYTRELRRSRAENLQLRSRCESARLVIEDLVEIPNAHAVAFARAWLNEGELLDDSFRVFRNARLEARRR